MRLMQFFWILNINFKKILSITLFILAFYDIEIELRCCFNPLKASYRQLLRHYPSMQIIYIQILNKIRFFVFIIFHVFVIAFTYWWIVWHILPWIYFHTINDILIIFNLLLFFKAACLADPGAEIKWARWNLDNLRRILQKFPKKSASNDIFFECTYHGIYVRFLFQKSFQLFLYAYNEQQ